MPTRSERTPTAAGSAGARAPEPGRDHLESLLEHLNEVVFQTDAAGRWTYLNPAWTRMTGFTVEDCLGVCFLDYVHPDDRDRNQEAFEPLIARQKEVCRHQVRYLTADGGFRWVEVHARLTLDTDDSIIGTSGTLRDVTELVKTEETAYRLAQEQGARAESERMRAQLEGILDTMGEGFLALDTNRRVTYVNRDAERLLERDRSELVGRWVAEALPELDLPAPEAESADGGPSSPRTHSVRHGDRELDIAVHASGAGYSLYVRDVTEYRQAQAELQQRLRVEAALANVAPLFLMGDDEELDDALAELGRLVDPTRAYIFSFDGTVFSNTHEWCAPGVESLHDVAQDLEASRFPVLATALQAGNVLDIPDTSELPAEATGERDVLERWAIRTALAVPVIGPHGDLKAFLGFDDVRGPRVWSKADLRILEVAAQMLGSRYARARAEAALRRSEERYRLATRATRDIIYEWDVESGALEQASAFESDLADPGSRDSDGLEWWAAQIHPDDRDDVTAGLEAALANSRDVWSDEYRFRRADGEYAMVLDRGHILRDAEGRPMRLIGAVSDITDRRTAEDALRASRTRLAEAERIAGLGSWEVDLATGKTRWSAQLFHLFQRDPDLGPLTMDEFYACVPEEDRALLLDALERARATHERFRIGHRVVLPDGSVRHHEVTAEVTVVLGRPDRLVGTTQDVTERRELEAQLHHSQRMEAVALLAGGVAHDFNNVLSAVAGAAELMRMDVEADDPTGADLDEILDAVRRGAALTRQLLGFSGKRISQPAAVDPNQLVADLKKMLTRLLPSDVLLDLALSPDCGAVFMDPGQLEQVVMNLIVNARDAMSKGGHVTVETAAVTRDADAPLPGQVRTDLAPGAYVRLSISDTGHGMDEATLQRVFAPFFTTKPQGKGTGLGLATVQRIVVEAGGGLAVESVPGEGSTFHIFLPPAPGPAQDQKASPDESEALLGHGETILLVDDEPTLCRLARRLLESHGYTVIEAHGPEEAICAFQEHEGAVDLLVSDVVMPRMNGVELAEHLLVHRPGLGVVLLSGHVGDTLVERGIFSSELTLLEKPLRVPRLLKAVREALEGSGEDRRLDSR